MADEKRYPTDPNGPRSSLSDALSLLGLRLASANADPGALAGYARMFSHGSMSPDVMSAYVQLMQQGLEPQNAVSQGLRLPSGWGFLTGEIDPRAMYAAQLSKLAGGVTSVTDSIPMVDPELAAAAAQAQASGGKFKLAPRHPVQVGLDKKAP